MTDDSIGFADVERSYVRRFVPDFDWLTFTDPSPRMVPSVPLEHARVALISSAGAHLPGSDGMGPQGEIRRLPIDADVLLTHVGYDTSRAGADVDVVHPAASLKALAAAGTIGSVAPSAVSTMGFIPRGRVVLDRLAPQAVDWLRAESVDLALLVPA